VTGGTITSNVTTNDPEVTLTNNPATTVLRITAAEPEPIPTTPWWMLALALMLAAAVSLRRGRGPGKRSRVGMR
jgi:hypothetical protein